MAQTGFLAVPDIKRYSFTQYLTSIATLQTALRADFPVTLGASFEVLATTAAPTVAIIVVPSGPTLSMNLNDYIGFNYGNWQVVPAASMGRTVADGATTSASTTVTSATAAFVSNDVGAVIATPNLPPNTTIVSITNGTTVVVSAAATATSSSQAMTITRAVNKYTPDVI